MRKCAILVLFYTQIYPKIIFNISLCTDYKVSRGSLVSTRIAIKTSQHPNSKTTKDPMASMYKRAAELKSDPKFVRMAVNDDLGLNSYITITRHLLAESIKVMRLER